MNREEKLEKNRQLIEKVYLALVDMRDNYNEDIDVEFDGEIWLDVEEMIGTFGEYLAE